MNKYAELKKSEHYSLITCRPTLPHFFAWLKNESNTNPINDENIRKMLNEHFYAITRIALDSRPPLPAAIRSCWRTHSA